MWESSRGTVCALPSAAYVVTTVVRQASAIFSDLIAHSFRLNLYLLSTTTTTTRMWASAQRDGRPAEYR